MGSVFTRQGKSGRTYYLDFYVNGRRVREPVGSDRDGITAAMAKRALAVRLSEVARGKFHLEETRGAPVFSTVLKEYLKFSEANKKPSSFGRDRISGNHLRAHFGNKRINEITSWHIEKYKVARRSEITERNKARGRPEFSFASINRELAMLKHLFNQQIKAGRVSVNPVKGIKPFKERKIERYLTAEEITSLLEACKQSRNPHLEMIVTLALNTGMRLREILNLKAENVDFKNQIIHLEDSKGGPDKVQMSNYITDQMKAYLKGRKTGYVFPGLDGKPFDNIRRSFAAALRQAGIEKFRFHDNRHTFASQLALAGVDLYTIQKLGRWKTLAMVQRYAHLTQAHKQNAANKLEKLFETGHNLDTSKIDRIQKSL